MYENFDKHWAKHSLNQKGSKFFDRLNLTENPGFTKKNYQSQQFPLTELELIVHLLPLIYTNLIW